MVRNEADRYLPSALEQWSDFADWLALLDNGDDETRELLGEHFSKYIYDRWEEPAWGDEAPARARLWETALATEADWILVLDADMVPARDPRPMLQVSSGIFGCDAALFNLYDLWQRDDDGRLSFRDDGYWKAHENWRVWMVRSRPEPDEGWQWPERGIHCGHFPLNLDIRKPLYAPCDYGLLHYAYLDPEDRERKYLQYADEVDHMSEREIAHAESILDPDPPLRRLPFDPEYDLR